MLRINCFVRVADADRRTEVIEHAKALVAATLANDRGCKGYDFFASATRPDVFMFCETWESAELLDAHTHAEHFKQHVGAIEDVAEISIESMQI